MSVELQMEILEAFASNDQEYMSLNGISKTIGKAYPQVHAKAKEMISLSILNSISIGRSIACTPNMNNPTTIMLLSLSASIKATGYYDNNPEALSFTKELLNAMGNDNATILYYDNRIIILTDLEQKRIIESYAAEILTKMKRMNKIVKSIECHNYSHSISLKGHSDSYIILHGYESFYRSWGWRN